MQVTTARHGAIVALLALITACSAPTAPASPTDSPSPARESSQPTVSPQSTPAPPRTPSPTPIPTSAPSYPPSTTGHGPDPIYGRAEPVAGAPEVAGAAAEAALERARSRLETATSYRFWMSIAGSGPAGEGLEAEEPLILSGSAGNSADEVAAAWSVTSPLGYPRRTIRYVVIADTVWCDSGIGLWTVFDGEQAELARTDAASIAPPYLFVDTFLDRSVDLVPAGRDRVGGEAALRLEARDPASLSLPGWWLGMDGELQSFVLWVTDDGQPMEAEAAGVIRDGDESGAFRMLIQVSGIDDPANQVEPPA